MQFLILLAIVYAFSSLLNADDHPANAAREKLLWTAIACCSVVALSWWISQMRRHASSLAAIWIRYGEEAHALAYLIAMMIVFGVLDFAQIVHANLGLSDYLWADEVVVGGILALPLLASWIWFRDPVGTDDYGDWGQRWSAVALQARYLLLLPLIPIFLLTGVADLSRLVLPAASGGVEQVLAIAAVLMAVVCVPWILRIVWPTSRLVEGSQRAALQRSFLEQGVAIRDIYQWKTSGRLVNAAVAGLVPRFRYLFVTDGLLRRLDDEALHAIAAHEAAHLKQGHMLRLAVSFTIPFLTLAVIGGWFLHTEAVSQVGVPTCTVLLLAGWACVHSRWAKLLEHEADLYACMAVSRRLPIDEVGVRKFATALLATGPHERGDWLHPTPADRIARLVAWSQDVGTVRRFQRRVRRLFRLLLICVVTLIGVGLWLA